MVVYQIQCVSISYLGVKFVEYVLEVVSLNRLLRVEKVEELLHELRRDIHFERADLN